MSHGSCAGGCCGRPEIAPGIRTALVVADEGEAAALAAEASPARRWSAVDAAGLDQVKLGILWALLAGRAFADDLVVAFAPLHEASADGPWAFRVPAPLVALLAGLDDRGAAALAPAWAGNDELAVDGWEPETIGPVLDGLRAIARTARGEGRALLLRVSL